jgi:hypothetical protein
MHTQLARGDATVLVGAPKALIILSHLTNQAAALAAKDAEIAKLTAERDYQISQRWADQEAREKAEARVNALEEALRLISSTVLHGDRDILLALLNQNRATAQAALCGEEG